MALPEFDMNWPDVVQAAAAVASVSLAFWIARLTARYAASTDQIVKANNETLRVLHEELNEVREERRAPVRNVLDRLESEMNLCLDRGLETMTADDLRNAAPRFSIRSHELVKTVALRDHRLAHLLSRAYDIAAEADRHLHLLSLAKSAERPEMFAMELSRLRSTLTSLSQALRSARDRLRKF